MVHSFIFCIHVVHFFKNWFYVYVGVYPYIVNLLIKPRCTLLQSWVHFKSLRVFEAKHSGIKWWCHGRKDSHNFGKESGFGEGEVNKKQLKSQRANKMC